MLRLVRIAAVTTNDALMRRGKFESLKVGRQDDKPLLECASCSAAAVAQLVESRIVIPVVVGSSPISRPKEFARNPFNNRLSGFFMPVCNCSLTAEKATESASERIQNLFNQPSPDLHAVTSTLSPAFPQRLSLLQHQGNGSFLLIRRIFVFSQDALDHQPQPGAHAFPR